MFLKKELNCICCGLFSAANLCTFDALVSNNDTRAVCGVEGTCHPCNNVAYLFLDQWSKDNLLVLAYRVLGFGLFMGFVENKENTAYVVFLTFLTLKTHNNKNAGVRSN